MGKYDDRAYEVGKGKPPAKHQWPKGTSGNPRGPRKRADRDKATPNELLAEIINEKVWVTINGKEVQVTKKELILVGLVHEAINGTASSRHRAYKTLKEEGALNLLPINKQQTPEQREAALRDLVTTLAKSAAASDPKYAAELRGWGYPDT